VLGRLARNSGGPRDGINGASGGGTRRQGMMIIEVHAGAGASAAALADYSKTPATLKAACANGVLAMSAFGQL
jgi:hypothetical protein